MNKRDYFKKRSKIMDRWNNYEISLNERNLLLGKLSKFYKNEWGVRLNEPFGS